MSVSLLFSLCVRKLWQRIYLIITLMLMCIWWISWWCLHTVWLFIVVRWFWNQTTCVIIWICVTSPAQISHKCRDHLQKLGAKICFSSFLKMALYVRFLVITLATPQIPQISVNCYVLLSGTVKCDLGTSGSCSVHCEFYYTLWILSLTLSLPQDISIDYSL